MKKAFLSIITGIITAAAIAAATACAGEAAAHPTKYRGTDYSKVYDYDYFVKRYPGLAKKYDYDDARILKYFATAGIKAERRGIATFDPKSYRYGNADLRRKFGMEYRKYYTHYMKTGYKEKSRKATFTGITVMKDPLTVFEGIDYKKIYDYEYVIRKYPKLIGMVGDNDEAVLKYFVRTGMRLRFKGKDPAVYPEASPSSETYQKLFRKGLYPTGKKLSRTYVTKNDPKTWNEILLRVIADTGNGGGYYTGSKTNEQYPVTTFGAMAEAFGIEEGRPVIDLGKARPSFCSSAVYMAMLKALVEWDKEGVISEKAWENLRPYTVKGMEHPVQDDGCGCFGRANSNGPGVAVLVKELGAGVNFYIGPKKEYGTNVKRYEQAWANAEPGDLLKIFRDKWIGTKERGHMVVYLGHKYALDEEGERDDYIYYWSSQSSTEGYGITRCRRSEIFRAVLTRAKDPAAFAKAEDIAPDDLDSWLASLISGRNSGVAEMRRHI